MNTIKHLSFISLLLVLLAISGCDKDNSAEPQEYLTTFFRIIGTDNMESGLRLTQTDDEGFAFVVNSRNHNYAETKQLIKTYKFGVEQ